MQNTILLIEDETKTGEMLKEALEFSDIQVILAKDGKAALDVMERGKFDLIILDLKLPGMPGEEVLEKIREIDDYVEVIVNTNYPTNVIPPFTMERLIEAGITKYITKGANADLVGLVAKVKEILRPFSQEEWTKILESMPKELFHEYA